jgi:uncharacterized protein
MRLALWISVCFALINFNANSQSQKQNNEKSLHVRGIAIMKQLPEIISVAINIKVDANEYNDCHDKLMSTEQKALEIFINSGIDKKMITTNELRVSQNNVYKNGAVEKVGYNGYASFIIETNYSVDFTKKLLTGLKNDVIAFTYTITFKLSEKQKELLRKEAISKAVNDAKEKALLIAESSKVTLGKIRSILYVDNFVFGSGDNDIVRENQMRSGVAFNSIDNAGGNVPAIEFNPREIRIVKAVDIDWLIDD